MTVIFHPQREDNYPRRRVNLFSSSARRSQPLQGLIPAFAVISLIISPNPAGAALGDPAIE